jgi:peptidoglycan/LPS O-acetylase OafA/YrhL
LFTRARVAQGALRALAPGAFVGCIVLVTVPPFDYRWLYDGPIIAFAVAAALCLLALCSSAARWLARPLEVAPMRWMGKISYSLYLWHVPLLTAFGLAGLPIAFLIAAASRRYVEEPFLRLKRRQQTVVPLPQAA